MPQLNNETEGYLKDLNALISMAESASDRRHILEAKLGKINSFIVWLLYIGGFVGVYVAYLLIDSFPNIKPYYQIGSIIILAFGVFAWLFSLQRKFKERSEIRKAIMVEKGILFELLDSIDGFKQLAFYKYDVSEVERMLMELRLSRIPFASRYK